MRPNHAFRTLLVFSFLLSLSLATFASPNQSNATRRSVAGAPLSGISTFTEDFLTATYRDAGATTATGWGTGTVTSMRSYGVQLLDHFVTPSPVRALDVQDHKAYVVLYQTSPPQAVRILDISDPYSITQLGSRDVGQKLISAKVDGDVFYFGTGYLTGIPTGCRLSSYNVTDPRNIPSPLDYLWLPDGNMTDLDVQGHFLYAAVYKPGDSHGFVVFDVENPASLDQITNVAGYSQLLGIDIDGRLAYLADGSYGLYIQNITNPYSLPPAIGHVDTPGNATDVLVDGEIAYLADGPSGVQIIDVSNPAAPVILGRYDTPGNAQRLALQGKTLYVADGAGGLYVLDVVNPFQPRYVTGLTMPYVYDIHLYGGDVLVAAADGVYAYRIGMGFTSLLYAVAGSYSGYQAWDVRVRGNVAYVAAGPDGLLTLNVSDPANPVLLDQDIYGTAPFYRKLDVQGTFVYVANYYAGTSSRGMLIYDASDPANLRYLARAFLTYVTDVAVAGDVAWIADGTAGLFWYNVSNPYSPILINSIASIGNVTTLWVQGYHLYVATQVSSGSGLRIYDIRDISSPTLVFSWNGVMTDHYDVFVDGDALYIADSLGYVVYWNVTDPFNAYYSDWIGSPYDPTGVWGFGPYILAAIHGYGVELINATNINALAGVTNNTNLEGALQLTIHGDYAYVTNGTKLVVLRLFKSPAASFVTSTVVAQSLAVDTTDQPITNATLTSSQYTPSFTSLSWQMSADGGVHWETVTPGVNHAFSVTGNDLRWRATLANTKEDRSAYIYGVSITYGYETPTTTTTPPPIPGFPLLAIAVGLLGAVGLSLVRQRSLRKR